MQIYRMLIVVIQFLLPLSTGQMGFGGGGYCAKCAMANSGMNSHAFGFGGMSNTPNFVSSLGTTQVTGNNFGAASLNSLDFETNALNTLSTGPEYSINSIVNQPSSTPQTDNSNAISMVGSNPCVNTRCFFLPSHMTPQCCGNGGCCGGFNPNFGGLPIVISPSALSNIDSSSSNTISTQLSSFGNNNPLEAGTFSPIPTTANLFSSQLGSNRFVTSPNSFVPLGSTNNFNGYIFTGRRKRRHSLL